MKKDIKDIIIKMDLYPRFEPDQRKIQEYSENIDKLPPIIINQDNVLIDGLHRIKAHKTAELTQIEVIEEKTSSDNEIYLRAIELNATHGLQLSYKDKQSIARKLYDLKNRQRLIDALSISASAFDKWVKNKAEQLKKERENEAINLYLQAELTQKEVAERIGLSEAEISRILQNCKFTEMEDFSPFLYNLWNSSKGNNEISHFGQFPQIFMENLLYYFTAPFDVVYDPFAGGGVVIDACKKWFRRYYVSDLNPIPAREEEIKKCDVNKGLPGDLPKCDFVFLDPPYWKQAENKYSKDKEDWANVSLDKFYQWNEILIKNIKKKLSKNGYITYVISGTAQKDTNYKREDHAIKITNIFIKNQFELIERIVLPYSSEQYNGTQVNIAKDKKIMLNLYRDLMVFRRKTI